MQTHSTNGTPMPSGRGRNQPALRQLGWPHYWLLVSILASGLLFFVLVLLTQYPGA